MSMRKYLELVRIGFMESAAYRFNAVMSLVTSILYLVMVYAIWNSIAAAGTLNSSLTAVMTYIVVGQVVSNSVYVNVENYISEWVREGTIVNELKRPITLRRQAYFRLVGETLFKVLTEGLPIALIGFLFLSLGFPGAGNTGWFVLSVFLSFNLVFAFSYLTSMLIFWTKVGWGIRAMRTNIQNVFSGVLFPLYLLPAWLAPFFDALPFKAIADTPIRIFNMSVTGAEIHFLILEQVGWIVVMAVAGELLWRKARRKITVQGG